MHIHLSAVKLSHASSLGMGTHSARWCVLTLDSFALSVKMNILLYLPGILVITFKTIGLAETGIHLWAIATIQVWLGLPFIFPHPRSYFSNAFDFSRQFLYKWTVNWRFVPEEVFLSKKFALSLLVGHLGVLMLFAIRRWIRYDGGFISVVRQGILNPFRRAGSDLPSGDGMHMVVSSVTSLTMNNCRNNHHPSNFEFHRHCLCTISTLSVLFLVCSTPSATIMENSVPRPGQVCVLFESHFSSKLWLRIALLMGIEYSWNVFPSTNISSYILNAAHALILIGIWVGYPIGVQRRKVKFKEQVHEVEHDTTTYSSSFDESEEES
jgi:alpha-1,3-mannosyltransferase